MTRVRTLTEHQALAVTPNARVAAIRWDLVAWSLVLDLDTCDSEAVGSPLRRTWLVFNGVHEITWDFENARLPNGFWISAAMGASDSEEFREYRFTALLPQFDASDVLKPHPAKNVSIRATGLVAVTSAQGAIPRPDLHGVLSRAQRIRLATDDELLEALPPEV